MVGDLTIESEIFCTDCIDSADIAAGAVGSSEIAADAVGTSEIADGTILGADIDVTTNIIASPIVGSWRPTSSKSNFATRYVPWSTEEENTTTNFYGFVSNADNILIKKSGYYRVTVLVLYSNTSDGQPIFWILERANNGGVFQEQLCRVGFIASGNGESTSCSAIEFFNANDRVKLFDAVDTASIGGGGLASNEDITFLNIERLN